MSTLRSSGMSRRSLLAATAALSVFPAVANRTAVAQAGAKHKIGIIGSGRIGGTIGGLWVRSGHPVMFSSRHPERLEAMAGGLGPLASTGTVAQAIAFGAVVFVAVPYGALPQIGRDHAAALAGKVVLDAGNAAAARDGAIADEAERDGIGVTSQKYLPGTRLVRAFNTLSYAIFAREANRAPPRLAIPIAGDDPQAVRTARALIEDAGFDPVVVGGLAAARRFQRGQPGYGLAVSAAELKQKLSLP